MRYALALCLFIGLGVFPAKAAGDACDFSEIRDAPRARAIVLAKACVKQEEESSPNHNLIPDPRLAKLKEWPTAQERLMQERLEARREQRRIMKEDIKRYPEYKSMIQEYRKALATYLAPAQD